jgi:hypothetical protein
MTCAEFKEQVAAWALGALTAGESRAMEAHLAGAEHQGCAEALRRARESLALIALAETPQRPSAAAWQAIERRLGEAPASSSARPWIGWLVAAAAVLLLFFTLRDRAQRLDEAAATARHEQQLRAACTADLEHAQKNAQLRAEALALLEQAGTRLVPLAPQGATVASANVIWSEHRAFVVGHALSPAPGKDYELWVIRGDQKIPAGLLRGDSLVAAIDPKLLQGGRPDALAVTLEAAGGRPQPEGPIVLVGKI